jgi:hypothetical protein
MWHRKLECILIHRYLVARGHYFLVEHNEKYYLLVNAYDFDIAKAWLMQALPMTKDETVMENAFHGVPIYEDTDLTKRVVCGIFRLLT